MQSDHRPCSPGHALMWTCHCPLGAMAPGSACPFCSSGPRVPWDAELSAPPGPWPFLRASWGPGPGCDHHLLGPAPPSLRTGALRAAWGLGTCPALSCPAVRFDWDKSLLKVYSASSRQWLPVCSSSWNSSHSLKTCQQLGFERWDFPWGPPSGALGLFAGTRS